MSRTHLAIRHAYLNLSPNTPQSLRVLMLRIFLNAHIAAW